jgi:hypothetical protein
MTHCLLDWLIYCGPIYITKNFWKISVSSLFLAATIYSTTICSKNTNTII